MKQIFFFCIFVLNVINNKLLCTIYTKLRKLITVHDVYNANDYAIMICDTFHHIILQFMHAFDQYYLFFFSFLFYLILSAIHFLL